MSKKEKRLGKGLKKDYRENLIGGDTQESKLPEVQMSNSLKIKKPKRERNQTTVYLTKEQLRAMKEIQIELLLNNDFKIENSEIVGLGIELLREIFKNPEIQKSKSLEILRSKCLDF